MPKKINQTKEIVPTRERKTDCASLEIESLESQFRDKIFKTQLNATTLKNLCTIIHMCTSDGRTDEDIQKLVGLTQSQIDLIRTRKEYYNSVHQVSDDSELTRMLLRGYKVKATQRLMEQCDEGNTKALAEYFKLVDKQDDSANSWSANYLDIMKRLGLETQAEIANKKIQEAEGTMIEEVNDQPDVFEDETPEEYRKRMLSFMLENTD